jgi:hypothetical protein
MTNLAAALPRYFLNDGTIKSLDISTQDETIGPIASSTVRIAALVLKDRFELGKSEYFPSSQDADSLAINTSPN